MAQAHLIDYYGGKYANEWIELNLPYIRSMHEGEPK